MEEYISIASRVLREEAEAIIKEIDELDQNFIDAVNLIFASSGRVIGGPSSKAKYS